MAEKAQGSWPTIRVSARENRAFLGRAVRYLAGQAGIRQFLDIGAGLPSADNVHEVAQGTAPSCRVVYAAHLRTGGPHRLPFHTRDSGEFARLAFAGLELMPPGVVVTSEWRPEGDGPRPMPAEVNTNGGGARKPQ